LRVLIAENDAAPCRSPAAGLERLENRVAYVDGCGNRGIEAGA
jgi:hypothetical protein